MSSFAKFGGSIMHCFRTTTLRQLLAISAVLLFASLPCSAQKLKGIEQEPVSDSHDQASIQRMLHVAPTKVRPMRQAVGTPVHSEPQALPHWSGSFKVTSGANRTATSQTYSYTMVGTDPSAGGTSNTTTVRTILVPLRLEFADGNVFDASTDIVAPLNTSAINNILSSPQFTPSSVNAGAVNLGNTQYADAMQRGNLWNKISKKPDYHVLLKPEVYPTQTVVVPADQGATYTDYPSGILYGVVNEDPNNSYKSPIDTFISSFVAQVNDPSALLIFVSHNIAACGGSCLGYHDVLPLGEGLEQTYIYTGYSDPTLFTFPYYNFAGYPDINTLSHEVSEWVNDPFVDNIVPAWAPITRPSPFCSATGYLEVGDPVGASLPQDVLSHVLGGVTWHPQDIVFLPWFEQASTSTSVNGWYTFANSTSGPPEPCTTSGDFKYTTLDFPQASRTRAISVNNQGTVVGRYLLAGVVHGFIYRNGAYTTLDVPGATATYPQGINDLGEVVGNMYDSNGQQHGFTYNAGVFQLIDFPEGLFTAVFGVNNSGVIVGLYGDANNFTPYGYNVQHAFQLLNGIFTTVDAPPFAYESYAYSINNSGTMVGGYDNGDQSQNYAFFGSPGSFAPFTLPNTPPASVDPTGFVTPGTDSQTLPFGLNDQNEVVGYYYEYGLPAYYSPQAFVWYGQAKTWQKLDAPGGWYTDLYGVNDKGTIVGDYRDRYGIHGVVLTAAGQ
jgi:probable HAF family extracellular repeat protein